MSVNFIKNNDIYIPEDAKQSGSQKKSPPEVLVEKDKKLGEQTQTQTKLADLNRVAELQKLELQEDELVKQSNKDLSSDATLVSEAMQTISEFINMPIRTVNFTQDDGSEKTVIKIYDSENNELIKQFPSEEILSIAQRIVELREDVSKKTGILLDESI